MLAPPVAVALPDCPDFEPLLDPPLDDRPPLEPLGIPVLAPELERPEGELTPPEPPEEPCDPDRLLEAPPEEPELPPLEELEPPDEGMPPDEEDDEESCLQPAMLSASAMASATLEPRLRGVEARLVMVLLPLDCRLRPSRGLTCRPTQRPGRASVRV